MNDYLLIVVFGLIVAGVFYLISKLTSKVEVKSFLTAIFIVVVFTALKLAYYHFNLDLYLDKYIGTFLKSILSFLPNHNIIIIYIIRLIVYTVIIWVSDLLIGGFKVKGLLWKLILAGVTIVLDIILAAYNLHPLHK